MNFHLFSLTPRDRKQKTHRESTGSSLMHKTVAVVVDDENNDIPPPPPQKKPRRGSNSILETIEENVLEESGAGAPRVTIRKTAPRNYAHEEREPIENIVPTRKHHRRSTAMTGDDFEGITMRCDELHGHMGPPRVRRPTIYNAGRWELQDGNKLRSCF